MSMSSQEIVNVALAERSYDIAVGPNALGAAGAMIAGVARGRNAVVLTDRHVEPLYLPRVSALLETAGIPLVSTISVEPGESSKSLENYCRTAEKILSLGIDRKTILIALGGGVVGDLAGFLAATLLRGIDFIQIPTTLLAQVDSSVGGKTGVDSAYGKNLIGAFHQPLLVIADTTVLTSLPTREMKAGYAEIVKYGLLGDRPFFEWLEEHGSDVLSGDSGAVTAAVAASCRAKAAIVAEDEREGGRRALLNLGHTFGHALEAESGFGEALNHGEAVSVGMVLAFDLSVRLGHCPANDLMRVRSHLLRHGLPVSPPRDVGFAATGLIRRMQSDKKAERGRLTFVLVRGIGEAFVARDVQTSSVEAALAHALAA